MRRKLQAKLNSKKGFTLVELLIVVAIIAILVAVSIPLVNTSLDKARIATDQANERAARAAATIAYLTETEPTGGTYYYDAQNGKLVSDANLIAGYGQCKNHKPDCVLEVEIDDDGTITMKWVERTNSSSVKGSLHGISGGEGASVDGG